MILDGGIDESQVTRRGMRNRAGVRQHAIEISGGAASDIQRAAVGKLAVGGNCQVPAGPVRDACVGQVSLNRRST